MGFIGLPIPANAIFWIGYVAMALGYAPLSCTRSPPNIAAPVMIICMGLPALFWIIILYLLLSAANKE